MNYRSVNLNRAHCFLTAPRTKFLRFKIVNDSNKVLIFQNTISDKTSQTMLKIQMKIVYEISINFIYKHCNQGGKKKQLLEGEKANHVFCKKIIRSKKSNLETTFFAFLNHLCS